MNNASLYFEPITKECKYIIALGKMYNHVYITPLKEIRVKTFEPYFLSEKEVGNVATVYKITNFKSDSDFDFEPVYFGFKTGSFWTFLKWKKNCAFAKLPRSSDFQIVDHY